MKIKLCGMMRPEDINYANEIKPDYVGFIFADSRRCIDRERAAVFKQSLNPEIKAVGVYVNEAIEQVAADYKQGIIDLAQLHGNEDEDYIKKLREAAPGIKLIKAIRVKNKSSVNEAVLTSGADFLLFDTYIKGMPGGSGESFDWKLLEDVKIPYFLAGGLHAGNIEASAQTGAFALDISSGIETAGVKDPEKMKLIVDLVRKQNK